MIRVRPPALAGPGTVTRTVTRSGSTVPPRWPRPRPAAARRRGLRARPTLRGSLSWPGGIHRVAHCQAGTGTVTSDTLLTRSRRTGARRPALGRATAQRRTHCSLAGGPGGSLARTGCCRLRHSQDTAVSTRCCQSTESLSEPRLARPADHLSGPPRRPGPCPAGSKFK